MSGITYFPQTLPANTVVGRLASNPGPTEAIPFAKLAAAIALGAGTYIASMAALRAATAPATTGTVIYLTGFSTVGDGGGGYYWWNASSSATDNSGTVIQPNAGGVGRWIRIPDASNTVNALSFGLVAGGTVANGPANKTALQAAITALGTTGGKVMIPAGFYYVDPGITLPYTGMHITVSGAMDGFSYEALGPNLSGYQGTVISWAHTGSIGFDLTGINPGDQASSYAGLENMMIVGTAAIAVNTGIKAAGMNYFSGLNVEGHTDAGIWLTTYINNTRMRRVSCVGNKNGTGYGLRIGTGATTLLDNTVFSASECVFRQNTIGIRIEQDDFFMFEKCVVESNAANGVELFQYHDGTGHSRVHEGLWLNCWFENNSAGDDVHSNLFSDAGTRSLDPLDTPSYMTFDDCHFVCYVTVTPGTFKPNLTITCGNSWRFRNCTIETSGGAADGASKSPVILGTNTSYIQFERTIGVPAFKNSNTVFTDSGSNNLTIDLYEEYHFTATMTGCTAGITGTARYVRNGKQIIMDFPTLTGSSNASTKTITGVPAQLTPTNQKSAVTTVLNNGTQSFGLVNFNTSGDGILHLFTDATGAAWATTGTATAFNFQVAFTLDP